MTDFSTWDRATLERLAQDLMQQNEELRAGLREMHAAWRRAETKRAEIEKEMQDLRR